tara:strand:- start:2730 stop:4022 length:1293 start_codon:yes stop_codon:yes gene_type:complete
MKIHKLIIPLFFSFSWFGFAETYVWEDYDDFSGSSLDTGKWGTMHLGGGIEPYVTDGKLVFSGGVGNPSSSKVVKPGWTEIITGGDGGQAWIYAKDTEVYGMEAEFNIPSGASSMSGLQLGIASLNPLSYATVELNADPNSASQYSQGFGFYHLLNGSETEKFGSTQRDITHKLGASLIDGSLQLFVDGEVKYEADSETFNTDMFFLNGFNDYQAQGLAFELNADNVRVLRQDTATTKPDPVTVVSDPNGQAVVVQVGEKYNWNSSLEGITLWGVEQSSDGWSVMTMRFENGRNFGNQGFFDSVVQPQPYDVLFEVDENGYIKSLEDDGDYQYYNPVSVDNGVIGTIQNDEGLDSVADNGVNQVDQWLFTTRAAAEEYYYSKVNPKNWMWFDHYPWVYSNEMKEWLYFMPSGGTLMYFSNNNKSWRKFSQ